MKINLQKEKNATFVLNSRRYSHCNNSCLVSEPSGEKYRALKDKQLNPSDKT